MLTALIEEFSAENFTSLRRVGVKFGKLNVLAGRNASGKSNALKALRLLSLLVRRTTSEACKWLGYENFREAIYAQDKKSNVTLKLHLTLDQKNALYGITLSSDGHVKEERLEIEGEEYVNLSSPGTYSYKDASGEVKSTSLPTTESFLHYYGSFPEPEKVVHPLIVQVKDFIAGWRFYSFNPEAIRGKAPINVSLELSRDGSNVPQVVHSLLTTDRRRFLAVESTLRELVPAVEELQTPVEGNSVYVQVKEKGFGMPFRFTQISDGAPRLLSFVTALSLGSPLVCFEEPENCVHPWLVEALVDMARKSPGQVVISTHSPALVDKLRLEELYIVERGVEGETAIRKAEDHRDADRVKRMLEEGFSLGEAWYGGGFEEDTRRG